MASTNNVKIKMEDETIIEPPSSNDAMASIEIEEDNLQMMSSKIASRVKYPPSCPVWHDLTPSSKRLDAEFGVVESVYMDFETAARVYRVKSIAQDGEPPSEQLLWERQLAFAMECPVKVKGMVENEPNKELEGVIVCPKPGKGNRKTAYSVRVLLGRNRVRVALGVESEQITFRRVEKQEAPTIKEETQGAGGQNNNQLDLPKEKNAQENKVEGANGSKSSDLQDASNKVGKSNETPEHAHSNAIAPKSEPAISFNPLSHKYTNEPMRAQPCNIKTSESTATAPTTLHETFERCKDAPNSSPLQNSSSAISSNNSQMHPAVEHPNETRKPDHLSFQNSYSSAKPNAHNHAQPKGPSVARQHKENGQLRPAGEQPHGVDPSSSLPIVSPKAGHQKSSSMKPSLTVDALDPGGYENKPIPHGRQEPPSSPNSQQNATLPQSHHPESQGVFCHLIVPLWVTDSTDRNIFFHLIGTNDFDKAYKVREISRITGCYVKISKNWPKEITLTPLQHNAMDQYDIIEAKIMIEDSLLDFLECSGSRTRLLYELGLYCELAVSIEGASHVQRAESGVVQQRRYGTNELVWMKLLDIPTFQNGDVLSFSRENLQHKVQNETQCSVEVFGQDLNNIKLSVDFCKPFVLICGECREHVGKVTRLVADAINEYRQRFENETQGHSTLTQNAALSKPSASPGKRKPPMDASSLPTQPHGFDSNERPTKVSKVDKTGTQSTEYLEGIRETTCILTVPLWVMQKCTQGNELFFHLLGYRGHNLRVIRSKTNCSVNLSHYSGKDRTPMTITIDSHDVDFNDVIIAKRMIAESLLEFMEDANSEGRLMYEMAMAAKGTYKFRQADGAIRQECQHSHLLVWMKLLELPSAELNGTLTPHGRYLLHHVVQQQLTDGTGCSVEVYEYPTLCSPYVLVRGNSSEEVNEVTTRVADKIEQHQQSCYKRCRFFN